jgi:hypothetical protein
LKSPSREYPDPESSLAVEAQQMPHGGLYDQVPIACSGRDTGNPDVRTGHRPQRRTYALNETTIRPWSAPIGHRQPRAADVPASTTVHIDPEEAVVDRKIRGVCRGC